MKKYLRFTLPHCITIIIVLLLSLTVFFQEFSSSIPKDTLLSVTATGKQSKDSWGQSVRIRRILVNGESIPLETFLPFCDGFSIEKGLLTAHQVPANLNITLSGVHRIDLDLIGEDGSGFAEIHTGSKKKLVNLYRQGGWHPIKWTYINYNNYIPQQNFPNTIALYFIVYAVTSCILRAFTQRRRKTIFSAIFLLAGLSLLGFHIYQSYNSCWTFSEAFFKVLENINLFIPVFTLLSISLFLSFPCFIFWALCIFTATEILSVSGSPFLPQTQSFLLNIMIILAVEGIVSLFISNPFLSTFIVSILMFFGAFANHYTLQFRGSPISISDISALKTALNVLDNYTLTVHPSIPIAIGLFILSLVIIYPLRNKHISLPTRFIVSLFSLLFIISLNTAEVQNKLKLTHNMWCLSDQCKEEGFWLTFFDRISLSFISKPDNFSDKTVKELEEKYANNDICPPDFCPNIIVVMNESFSDLENFDEFSSSEPIIPFLHSLKGLPNTYHGLVQVPVFGGNTCISEFEFMSGVNLLHYPINSPYDIIRKDIRVLPNIIKTLGYTSIALHPSSSSNWSRDIGFSKIGFDQAIFNDTGMQHRETVRHYISDKSFYNEIIMLDQQTENPLFLFGITMQNHGGYSVESFDEPIQIVSPAGNYPLATQYINLIRESDRAFENFITYYEKQEEPTIILFFGDHLPKVESNLLDSLHASYLPQSSRDKLVQYHTPYYIWANFELDKSQLPSENSLISLSLLQSVLMKSAGLPMTGYQQFLFQLLQQYPVISSNCILDADGNLVDPENQEILILKDYIYLQYALLKNKSDLLFNFWN